MKGALRLLRKVFAVLTRPVLLYPLTGLFWGGFILLTILVREEIEIGAWKWPPSLAKPGELLTDFENQSIDWRFHWRGPEEASPDIMILAISNSSLTGTTFSDQELAANPDLKLLETWPWPRKAWSKIIERLLASGAKMVALDVVFSTPSKAGAQDDLALQKTIWKHRDRLVLGATYKKPAPGVPSELLLPNDTLLEPFEHDEEIVALVNYEYSSGTIREMPTRELDLKYDYMASLVAKKAGWAKGSSPDLFFINYAGPGGSFKTVDLYKIFYPAAWNRELQGGKVFKDKVIFIGGTASIFQDLHFTPFGITPGVEIHANALANFHDRPMLERFSALTVLLVAGFLQGLFLSLFSRPAWKVLPAIAFPILIGWIAQYEFTHDHLIIPLVLPLIISALTSVNITAWQAATEFLARQRTRKTLETYVSPNIASYIIEHEQEYQAAQAGQRKPCTIMFSDIRGFTTMTESSPDETKLVEQLNEYLTKMVHCIFRHGGTLHKFIGDGIMAVWGDTHSFGIAEDALRASQCALEMRVKLAELNEKWKSEGKPELKIGVGLNHGQVVVGAIGSLEKPQRLEFTVIGDAVNVASRVESETKNQAVDLLISESVHALVAEQVEAENRGAVALKGKAGRIGVYFLKSAKAA